MPQQGFSRASPNRPRLRSKRSNYRPKLIVTKMPRRGIFLSPRIGQGFSTSNV